LSEERRSGSVGPAPGRLPHVVWLRFAAHVIHTRWVFCEVGRGRPFEAGPGAWRGSCFGWPPERRGTDLRRANASERWSDVSEDTDASLTAVLLPFFLLTPSRLPAQTISGRVFGGRELRGAPPPALTGAWPTSASPRRRWSSITTARTPTSPRRRARPTGTWSFAGLANGATRSASGSATIRGRRHTSPGRAQRDACRGRGLTRSRR